MLIRYIGAREHKRDNVTESGTVWTQAEPVQDVPEDVAQTLLRYPTVWVAENVEAAPAEPEPVATEPDTDDVEPRRPGRPRKNAR